MEEDRLAELLSEADYLPDGPAKLALIEEAVRLADSLGDLRAGFALRVDYLMWNAICSGHPDKMVVAFAWCLARHDQFPEEFDGEQLLWRYTHWVVYVLRKWPGFSRRQIADAFDDLTARLQRAGRGLRAVARERCLTALALGDLDEATERFRRWHDLPVDPTNDHPAEECRDEVHFHLCRGELERAVEHAAPIFDGRLRSDTVPHGPFAELMEPLVLLGRPADAMRCHLQGYPLIARQMRWLGEVGRHLGFLALTDNLDAALRLLETHAPWPVASVEVDDRYYFHLAVRFLLERVQDAGRPTLHLRLPEGFPCRRDDGVYDTAALRGWFEGECEQVAARYDARNGNDHFSRTTLGASRRLREHVAPFPLPARPRGPKGNK